MLYLLLKDKVHTSSCKEKENKHTHATDRWWLLAGDETCRTCRRLKQGGHSLAIARQRPRVEMPGRTTRAVAEKDIRRRDLGHSILYKTQRTDSLPKQT
jgi:hypothetical protein